MTESGTFDPQGRRRFFRGLTARLVGRVAEYLESRLPEIESRAFVLLRPPGAIAEDRFASTCQRCGECVKVCPVQAIRPLDIDHANLQGTPVINADRAACVVCDGLMCTHVCPSGALFPLAASHEIEMGLAEVYAPLCVRSAGELCTLCVDRCPLGSGAIRFPNEGPPEVLSPGCVGCGVCQLYCPTSPKAITVRPR